jgi:hypothetical protein
MPTYLKESSVFPFNTPVNVTFAWGESRDSEPQTQKSGDLTYYLTVSVNGQELGWSMPANVYEQLMQRGLIVKDAMVALMRKRSGDNPFTWAFYNNNDYEDLGRQAKQSAPAAQAPPPYQGGNQPPESDESGPYPPREYTNNNPPPTNTPPPPAQPPAQQPQNPQVPKPLSPAESGRIFSECLLASMAAFRRFYGADCVKDPVLIPEICATARGLHVGVDRGKYRAKQEDANQFIGWMGATKDYMDNLEEDSQDGGDTPTPQMRTVTFT